jgi:hypothetical protein
MWFYGYQMDGVMVYLEVKTPAAFQIAFDAVGVLLSTASKRFAVG